MEDLTIEQEFYFQWHITEKCNSRCLHCYHESYASENELSFQELEIVLREIEKALNAWGKSGSISLTGGEPFMRRNDLIALADLIDLSPVIEYYDILTNGILISDEDVVKLQEMRKLRRVQMSLEAPEKSINDAIRGKDAFDSSIDTIRRLKAADRAVSVMMTVTRENITFINDMIELLAAERVDTLAIERFIPEGSGSSMSDKLLTKNEVRTLYEQVHEIGLRERRIRILMYRPLFVLTDENDPTVGAMCSVGTNALTIMHDGTILPCRRLPIPIGHVLKGGIFEAWYDSELLWEIRQSSNLKGKCSDCELLPACRGCRAMAYYATGDYLEEDPHCWKEPVTFFS